MDNDDTDNESLAEQHKRVRTPTILQMEATECGAASLSIILAYYGLYITSEKARELCGVSRDGAKAINVIKAARTLGMDAQGIIVQDLDLLRYTPTPFIIYWKFEHFMVVEGIKKNKVYVNDPATGPRTMPIEEFDKDFTGVVLNITPGENFQPGGKKEQSTFQLLAHYFKSDLLELNYILLASILLAIPQASLALFIQFFIDNIILKQQTQWMPGFMMGMGIVIVSIILLLYLQQFFIVRYKLFFSVKNVPHFFQKLLHLPMSFYSQRSSGDIANRMYIFDMISEKITKAVSELVISLLSILIYSAIILFINPTLGLITILITLISFSSLIVTKRKIVDLGRRYSYDKAKMYGIEYSGVQMIDELKFMSGENRFFSRWLSFNSKLIETRQKIDFYTALLTLFPSVLYFFNLILLVILSMHFVMQGSITVGGVMAIYTLLLLFSAPVVNIVDHFLKLNELKADLIRVKDVELAYRAPEASDLSKLIKPGEEKNNRVNKQAPAENLMEISDLIFGYSKLEAPILSDINIQVKKGKTIAITGMSGGGKSSLLNVICGLFEPWAGTILLKGKNIKSYQPKELFKIISYVDQNIFLFEGTIRDNLTMWDNTIKDDVIIEALKAACVYETVNIIGGLDYLINEGGANISLGQAQRLELARALIKKPEVILLDEATSALDSVTEAKIYENLRRMDCTFLIVAHRLSATRHCDEIIVIEDGGIVERGTHEELLALDGRYKEFLVKDYLS